ncbi:MAG: hypothetical protein M3O30_06360 [Planctomycetota bacterium]|nr:hypothetical protein [Planctomycetota bacterium]
MAYRRVLLRIILGCLAVAAGLGALAVLTGSSSVMGEAIATLILVAISAAIVMGVTRALSSPDAVLACYLAVALVAAEFVCSLLLIWGLSGFFRRQEETILALMATLAITGIPAVFFLRYLRHPRGFAAAVVGLGVCAVAFCIWMAPAFASAGLWNGPTWADNFWGYGWVLLTTGIVAAICLFGLGTDRWHWRWVGVISAAVAAGIMIVLIYSNVTWATHIQPLGWLIAIAVVVAHANLALRCPLSARSKWLAYGTIAAMIATGVLTNLAAITEVQTGGTINGQSPLERLSAACAILAACGSLALAILGRLNARPAATALVSMEKLTAVMTCPICNRKHTLTSGTESICGCGMKIQLVLRPPACASCGYSLLMIKGDVCPECGAAQGGRDRLVFGEIRQA